MRICDYEPKPTVNLHRLEGHLYDTTNAEYKYKNWSALVMLCQISPGVHNFISVSSGNRNTDDPVLEIPKGFIDVTNQYCLQKVK